MAKTIQSIIKDEIERLPLIDRERLVDNLAYDQVAPALSEPGVRDAVMLMGEKNLGPRDLNRKVADERCEEVRAVVRRVLAEIVISRLG